MQRTRFSGSKRGKFEHGGDQGAARPSPSSPYSPRRGCNAMDPRPGGGEKTGFHALLRCPYQYSQNRIFLCSKTRVFYLSIYVSTGHLIGS